jgi:hypothetical protein
LALQLSRFFNEHGGVLHQLDCGLAQRFGFPTNLFGSWFFWHATIMARSQGRREDLWRPNGPASSVSCRKRYTGLTISNSNFPTNEIIYLRLLTEKPL